MTYAYLRVSTEEQTLENQKFVIEKTYKIDKYYTDTISGTIDYQKRELGKLLKKANKDDTIIITEISRLGRSLYMIFNILSIISNKQINLISIKENLILDNTISSKVLCFAFGISAEIERNLISQRTKEALALRKAQGIKIGGGHLGYRKCDKYKDLIFKYLEHGKSKSWICRKYKISRPTLNKWISEI